MVYVASGALAHFLLAAAMAPLAFVFDVLDGRVARWRQQHSRAGPRARFAGRRHLVRRRPGRAGALPAGLRGGWDVVVLIYFVCCGVSRLARYNVTAESLSAGADKVAYFEGTPIPTSVVLTAVLAGIAWQRGARRPPLPGGCLGHPRAWTLHPLALLFVLSGTLMISKTLRIPKI